MSRPLKACTDGGPKPKKRCKDWTFKIKSPNAAIGGLKCVTFKLTGHKFRHNVEFHRLHFKRNGEHSDIVESDEYMMFKVCNMTATDPGQIMTTYLIIDSSST